MKLEAKLRRRLGLFYVATFVAILLVDAVVNSAAYRDQFGSQFLKLGAIGLGLFFWIWMLIDLMTRITRTEYIKKPWLWSAFVVMTYVVGALVYYIVIYYPLQKIEQRESLAPH